MGGFSTGEAIASGFRLIGRNPVAILWWAGAYLVLGVLPVGLALWAVGPDLLTFYQQLARGAVEGPHPPDMAAMAALQSRFALLQPVSLLSNLVTHSVLLGAIYRGVLHPDERRFGYLRFSMREVWLGLVIAVLYVAMILVIVAIAIPAAIVIAIGAAGARAGGGGQTAAVAVAVGLVGVGVLVWLAARFILALPMSFDRRTFAVGESWTLTRGRALPIVGVGLAVFVIAVTVEIVFASVVGGLILASVTAGAGLTSLIDTRPEELIGRLLPWLPVWFGFGALLGAVMLPIVAAPAADIYRQLTGDPAEA